MKRGIFFSFIVAVWGLVLIGTGSVQAHMGEISRATTSSAAFGKSVSLSGEYALIGAFADNSYRGSAYVFLRDGASLVQQAKLTAADGVAGDRFGLTVSLSGDCALIGAYRDNSDAGAAYIFKRQGTNWPEQTKLIASDGAAGDRFGWSVSIDGNRALVGADGDDNERGSAYLFLWDGNTWVEQAKLTASDGAAGDCFGWSVSIDGNSALIGAYFNDSHRGAAYLFIWDGSTWVQQAKLTAADSSVGDQLGYSVSLCSDYALVGAYADDDKGSNSGSAYLFKWNGIAWSQYAKLIAHDGAANDGFGVSVNLSGDYALVGAQGDDSYRGSAYLFECDGSFWDRQPKLTASDGEVNNYFGISVSLYGDYALIGASEAGKRTAYLFGKCPSMDVTGDCFVNFQDLALIANQWLTGYQ